MDPKPNEMEKTMRDTEERMSDFRAGYSTGYADAKAGEAMDDETAAARFLNLPVWDVTVHYNDLAATDDDGSARHYASVYAKDEASAVERVENELRAAIPSAHIDLERTEAMRETND